MEIDENDLLKRSKMSVQLGNETSEPSVAVVAEQHREQQ